MSKTDIYKYACILFAYLSKNILFQIIGVYFATHIHLNAYNIF